MSRFVFRLPRTTPRKLTRNRIFILALLHRFFCCSILFWNACVEGKEIVISQKDFKGQSVSFFYVSPPFWEKIIPFFFPHSLSLHPHQTFVLQLSKVSIIDSPPPFFCYLFECLRLVPRQGILIQDYLTHKQKNIFFSTTKSLSLPEIFKSLELVGLLTLTKKKRGAWLVR